jgi:hypothetical protein
MLVCSSASQRYTADVPGLVIILMGVTKSIPPPVVRVTSPSVTVMTDEGAPPPDVEVEVLGIVSTLDTSEVAIPNIVRFQS